MDTYYALQLQFRCTLLPRATALRLKVIGATWRCAPTYILNTVLLWRKIVPPMVTYYRNGKRARIYLWRRETERIERRISKLLADFDATPLTTLRMK